MVLDRYDAQKYYAYKIIEPQIKGCLDRERALEEQLKESRKQAVKEFIQAINKEYELFDDVDEIFFSCLREDIKRIAKEFGVELD